ncbi:alpha/beta hydrolase [Promicromonospora sp. NPDC050249]|uniref:alpha/beta hydrolase n=1 Tax=Promicromonospora sp. NPDC050249 TaxID=3154743 RepID=UPI0033E7E405
MTPVLFIHGLWIHASAWRPWLSLFDESGYSAQAPGWPGDGETVEDTRLHPERLAGIGIDQLTDHYAAIAAQLPQKPIVVGHSFGGLVAQKLLAADVARAAVAIDPAPIKGVRALPLAQIRSALPVVSNKANTDRAVSLTARQFRYGFGNALSRSESDQLHGFYSIPGPGRPVFELTGAKHDPSSPTRVRLDDTHRGPLLVLGGTKDHTIPEIVARQAAALYEPGSNTQYRRVEGRGHSLVFDSGWQSVAQTVLDWISEHDRAAEH